MELEQRAKAHGLTRNPSGGPRWWGRLGAVSLAGLDAGEPEVKP
jgi:hypothetical protein